MISLTTAAPAMTPPTVSETLSLIRGPTIRIQAPRAIQATETRPWATRNAVETAAGARAKTAAQISVTVTVMLRPSTMSAATQRIATGRPVSRRAWVRTATVTAMRPSTVRTW